MTNENELSTGSGSAASDTSTTTTMTTRKRRDSLSATRNGSRVRQWFEIFVWFEIYCTHLSIYTYVTFLVNLVFDWLGERTTQITGSSFRSKFRNFIGWGSKVRPTFTCFMFYILYFVHEIIEITNWNKSRGMLYPGKPDRRFAARKPDTRWQEAKRMLIC